MKKSSFMPSGNELLRLKMQNAFFFSGKKESLSLLWLGLIAVIPIRKLVLCFAFSEILNADIEVIKRRFVFWKFIFHTYNCGVQM